MEEIKKCPKCGSEMEKGSILNPGSISGLRWQKGEFKKLLNVLGRLHKIDSYKCGYLENYVK